MKVWYVTAKTESGDDLGVFLFKGKPTKKTLEALFRENYPCEFDDEPDGPGEWGSYIYVSKPAWQDVE